MVFSKARLKISDTKARDVSINVIKLSLTQLFVKYFMNLQLSATPSLMQPADGPKKPKHVALSSKFVRHLTKNCARLYFSTLFN